jgi:hypothetical protein
MARENEEEKMKPSPAVQTTSLQPSAELIEYAKAQANETPNLTASDLYAKVLARFGSGPDVIRAAAGASIAADPGFVHGFLIAAVLWPLAILRDAVTARRRERVRAEAEAAVRLAVPDRCVDWPPQQGRRSTARGPAWLGLVCYGLLALGIFVLILMGVMLLVAQLVS